FPSLKYFRHARNLGMSGNPRWIVQKPDTDFIVKLDSDDRLHPNFVARLVDHLCQHPRAGYAHSAVQQIDANGHNGALRLLARSTGFQSGEQCLRESVSGYRVAANICMFRRAALQEVNYFRPDLPFADDWDLSL